MRTLPRRVYTFRSSFRAPLPFVFRWCTDYTPEDPGLEAESYTRKIVRKRPSEVVYEDLEETPRGWMWSRQVVTLHPPDRWTARSEGTHRTWDLDYRLRPLPDGRTELTFRGERRPTPLGGRNPPKRQMENDLRRSWAHFGRALEAEYRQSDRARARRSKRRR